MVELRTRKREMSGEWGHHHRKLGLQRMLCVSQFTFPDRAGMRPNLLNSVTDLRSSKPNRATHTPDFSYLLTSSIWFSSSSPISLSRPQLYHHRQIQSRVISLHLAMPWSWVNTDSGIHRVPRTLNPASTQVGLSSLHSHNYKLTPQCSFSFWHASL